MAAIRMKTEFNAQHSTAQFVPVLGALSPRIFVLLSFSSNGNFNGKMKFFTREAAARGEQWKAREQHGISRLTLTNIAQ